jgi:YVTN family beta-propeller protein
MPVMLRQIMLVIGALTLTACAQAAATPFPDTPPLEPLPPLSTPTPVGDAGAGAVAADAMATTTTLPPSDDLMLVEEGSIWGDIAPKSVIATGNGLFFAQNMMYRHTVTVYNRDRQPVATIPDTVDLSAFGINAAGSSYQGAPVEAVATSDGAFVYVSNYQMYGPGYGNAGGDTCERGGWDESFVYRITTDDFTIDQVIPVGAVPKYVALTPDDSTMLVTNWCSFDLSVIDTASLEETARIPLGRHPRGIAVTSDGASAYIAVMGSTDIAIVDLGTLQVRWIRGVGNNPRHLVLSPDDRYLYATLNGDDRVIRIDLETQQVLDRVSTGDAPRSMAISDDGLSLYVVNYESDTVTKLDALTMNVLQDVAVGRHPIGVTFDNVNRSVWVASYSGVITVLNERDPS